MKRQAGFTLIELMVVVTILAIVLGVAVPNLRPWVANMQVRTKAEAMLNGLQLARGEALRRNTRVMFSAATNMSWVVGCEVVVTADNDGDGVADCPSQIQAKASGEAGTSVAMTLTPNGATRVTFSGVGMVAANADGSATISQIDFSSTSVGTKTYRVLITTGGQSRICDPAVTDATKPERC